MRQRQSVLNESRPIHESTSEEGCREYLFSYFVSSFSLYLRLSSIYIYLFHHLYLIIFICLRAYISMMPSLYIYLYLRLFYISRFPPRLSAYLRFYFLPYFRLPPLLSPYPVSPHWLEPLPPSDFLPSFPSFYLFHIYITSICLLQPALYILFSFLLYFCLISLRPLAFIYPSLEPLIRVSPYISPEPLSLPLHFLTVPQW